MKERTWSIERDGVSHVVVDEDTAGAWVWTQAGIGGTGTFELIPQNFSPKAVEG